MSFANVTNAGEVSARKGIKVVGWAYLPNNAKLASGGFFAPTQVDSVYTDYSIL